jgi:addiction module RelE/StbE family toxin
MKARWSRKAKADLESIFETNRLDNLERAIGIERRIVAAVAFLIDFPKAGVVLSDTETRRCIVRDTPYILYYRVIDAVLIIDAVLHRAMRRPT